MGRPRLTPRTWAMGGIASSSRRGGPTVEPSRVVEPARVVQPWPVVEPWPVVIPE